MLPLCSNSPPPSAVALRPPRLPASYLGREVFIPEALLRHKAAVLKERAEKGGRELHEGLEGLEALMARMLRSARLPASPVKDVFSGRGVQRGRRFVWAGGGPPSLCARDSRAQLVSRMRCRTVLQVYALLDPVNAGYIDPETACACIAHLRRESEPLAELLLQVLEDMVPFISPRGVIEKDVFLETLYQWIEASLSSTGPYHRLRTASNPVSDAFKAGLPCTLLTARSFYQSSFLPRGLGATFERLKAEREVTAVVEGTSVSRRAEQQRLRKKAAVSGDLQQHIKLSAMRKGEKVAALKEELEKRNKDECTFKPQISTMPSFGSPFPSRRQVLGSIQKDLETQSPKGEGLLLNAQRQLMPLDSEVALPPVDPDSEEEKEKPQKLQQKGKEQREQESREVLPSQEACGPMSPRSRRERKAILASSNPTSFDVWVFHQGNPGVKPLQLQECLRVAALPSVPLDGLSSDDSSRVPPCRVKKKGQSRSRGGALGSTEKEEAAAAAHTLGKGPLPSRFSAPHAPYRQPHKPQAPLTPGLAATFKTGFFRERIRESPEERRLRLGRWKSSSPPPTGFTEAVAEIKGIKEKLLYDAPLGGGPEDPLLWQTDPTDFQGGLTRQPKRQPPFSAVRRREHPEA